MSGSVQFDLHDDGSIEGYGAHKNNIDSHGDVIENGAFADTIAQAKRTGKMPSMLLQHADGPLLQDALPIGIWDSMHEDAHGLWMKGRLALGNSRANDVYALLKMSPPALSGLSIGFIAKKFTMMPKTSDVRRKLHAIDLREVSVVHHPSNDLARIKHVKSRYGEDAADKFTRALERLQRELAR